PSAGLALSALVCGDVTGTIHDVAGALAVAGAATLSGFSVGAGIGGAAPANALFVNGGFDGENGEIHGNAFWQTAFETAQVTFLEGGAAAEGDPLGLTFMCYDMRAVSLALGSAATTALADLHWWDGQVVLRGTDPVLNIFRVEA